MARIKPRPAQSKAGTRSQEQGDQPKGNEQTYSLQLSESAY